MYLRSACATYLINGDGDVTVDNKIQFTGLRINLARIGVRYEFDKKFDKMTYFGRGPIENYADRKTASDVGLYTLDVNDQYECEKPMEHGKPVHRLGGRGPVRQGPRRSPQGRSGVEKGRL